MPSPSPGKCRGAVVRQLSLQNQTPRQGAPKGLKKQFSEDDGRALDPAGVTGQGWGAGSERPVPILRLGSGDGKTKVSTARPKPVKVAWADRKADRLEAPAGVEVIATKCQGQPRPPSVKAQRLRSPLLGSKDSLVYSRLQLEERLRNAWSERAKIKPNINIFLARGGGDLLGRESDEPATDRPPREAAAPQDSASALSDSSAPLDKKRKSMRMRAFYQDFCPPDFGANLPESRFVPRQEGKENLQGEESSPRAEERAEGAGRPLQELNKIEIRMVGEKAGKEEVSPEDSPSGVKRCRNKENAGSKHLPPDAPCGDGEDAERKATPPVTAQDRRANFRRSSAVHKTINESFSGQQPEEEKGRGEVEDVDPKAPPRQTQRKPPLARAFSAPSQSEPSDPHKAANLQKKVKIIPQRRLQPSVSFDVPSSTGDEVAASRERIKSAPVRRRLKSAAARRKSKEKESSDEEEAREATSSAKKTTRRPRTKSGGEIVTMVSLVSPAASDTEDSLINLPEEQWEEKEDSSRTEGAGRPSAGAEEPKDAFVVQKFVSLRKTTKSVTFQPHPVLNRGYSASFPSRRAPAGTPVLVPTPVVTNPALTPAQLLERDKRPSAFPAGGPGVDGRGVKRRLLRSYSESPKDEDSLDLEEKPASNLETSSETKETTEEAEDKDVGRPELKCPKEKECWNLYQKMVEKGVTVSFDTVLRGMLTPTEYRLRKNRLLSNC